MYSILFHVGWLALIEIIFYFQYIGPLESQLFKNSIKDIINDYKNKNDDIDFKNELIIVNPYNQSQFIHLDEPNKYYKNNKNDAKKSENNRIEDNNKLYQKAIIYWVYYFLISFFISIFYICCQYYIFNQNKINKMNSIKSASELKIEMTEKRDLNYFFEECSENNNENIIDDIIKSPRSNKLDEIENQEFFNFKNIKKKCLNKISHYLALGILILGFEYLFFTYIVLNYKVISSDEMIYLVSQLINPLLNKIYNKSI